MVCIEKKDKQKTGTLNDFFSQLLITRIPDY